VNTHGGSSAIEQSSYISRTIMYSERDGRNYYPKYSEDLVHTEVMLPANAPPEYSDSAVLWNSVEKIEKAKDAQLARTFRVELPNEWTYNLAIGTMRDFVKRNFTDVGMCAQFAIHDSENKNTGQRNLHCHIMLTLRGIDEQGKWMPKQKKVYLKDENGERIPLIDKVTGKQKVDKQNRKQWKCTTIPTNDWNSKEKVGMWRKDLADTINSVNEQIGNTEKFWEHRSFKEQGLDIEPQVHLGEKVSALERAGVKSIRGDINRDIIARNALIVNARIALEEAKKALEELAALPVTIVGTIINEIIEVLRKVAERNKGRLKLKVAGSKYLAFVSDKSKLQNLEYMENYVHKIGVSTYEELEKYRLGVEPRYKELIAERQSLEKKTEYYKHLLDLYNDYEPYYKVHAEVSSKRGIAYYRAKKKHSIELMQYEVKRKAIKDAIEGTNKNITPGKWREELKKIDDSIGDIDKEFNKVCEELARVEVLEHNKKELKLFLENESHKIKNIERSREVR
jgi:hypothetical protein